MSSFNFRKRSPRQIQTIASADERPRPLQSALGQTAFVMNDPIGDTNINNKRKRREKYGREKVVRDRHQAWWLFHLTLRTSVTHRQTFGRVGER